MQIDTPMRNSSLCRKSRAVLCALTVLAACSNSDVSQPDAAAQEVDAIIAAAVEKTAQANTAVSEIEKHAAGFVSETAVEAEAAPDTDTGEDRISRHQVTIDWKGPIEPLADSLARHIGYQLVVAGPPPANPVQVAVTGFSGSPLDAVAALNVAAFGHASVVADESNKTVTLAYRR